MLDRWKKIIVLGFVIIGLASFSGVVHAADDKLLYDLTYDKDRNVLTGKTTPNLLKRY